MPGQAVARQIVEKSARGHMLAELGMQPGEGTPRGGDAGEHGFGALP